jgi:DNA-binding NarL/FixJ family response regulator
MIQNDATTIRILIADDDAQTRESLKKLLSSESDFKVVGTASTGHLAMQLSPHIIRI